MPQAPNLKPMSARRKAAIGTLIGLGVAAGLSAVRATGVLDGIEWQFIDLRTRAALGETKPDPRIVIAEVHESDVNTIKGSQKQTWPWPLSFNAAAFRWLAECGVAAVVVDVYHFDHGAGPGELNGAAASAEEADELAEAYEQIGKVALAMELAKEDDPPHPEPLRIEALRDRLKALPPLLVPPAITRAFPSLPVAHLLRGASQVGFANADSDADSIVRRAAPAARIERLGPGETLDPQMVPSLPLAGALLTEGAPAPIGPDGIRIGTSLQRLDSRGSFIVNFRGSHDTFPHVSPADLILQDVFFEDHRDKTAEEFRTKYGGKPYEDPSPDSPISRAALKGKIVIWGVNIKGIKDVVGTPVSEVFPGPEFQATVLDNLLHGDGRVAASSSANALLLALLCTALGVVGGGWRARGGFIGACVFAGVLLYLAASRWFASGWSIDLFTPAVGIVFTYAGVTAFHLLTEGKRNKWLEGTFGQYLSPSVIAALKANPDLLQLGGRSAEVTVLFSDVKGFTSLSEQLPPDRLVPLLNKYLTGQSKPVLDHEGVIDKFIGDAVMAFFGDPVPQGDHALRACRAAVRCRQVLPAMKALTDELGVDPIVNRIGINSGPAKVGNMGSELRFDYTVMGNTVNLASRLEGANKAFGSWILLGSETYERAKAGIVAKRIGRIQVVGKKEAVAVYELLDLAGEATPETQAHVEAYDRARRATLDDNLEDAEAALDEAEKVRPGDGPTSWMRWLVRDLREGRLRRPWDEVVVLESK